VTGTVRVKLYKGNIITAGRKIARQPLQPEHRDDGGRPDQAYNQDDATGFIRLNGLRLRVDAQVNSKAK